jgi:uncharacterized protein
MSPMESQFRDIVRQKIVDSLAAARPTLTRRDIRLPGIPGKAITVIGMRRAGKTTFLWQILADRHTAGMDREGLLYFSFEDERLAGMSARDLNLVIEEYYRLKPDWRDRRRATSSSATRFPIRSPCAGWCAICSAIPPAFSA